MPCCLPFLIRLERNTKFNFFVVRLSELFFTEFVAMHIAACIFYYLAARYPPDMVENTWLGSLKLGEDDFSDFHFREISELYCISLYWAFVTMAAVGKTFMPCSYDILE